MRGNAEGERAVGVEGEKRGRTGGERFSWSKTKTIDSPKKKEG